MKPNNFNKVAFIYDTLANLVFGRSMSEAQQYFLDAISAGDKVLILGGGTGWILKYIREDCEVYYIDASSAMIAKAQKRNTSIRQIHFITGTEEDIPNHHYDMIITNFYFDLFSTSKVTEIIQQVKRYTSETSKWIVTDFVNAEVWWQRLLLRCMYSFFSITCSIESKTLPFWINSLTQSGLQCKESKSFYKKFITTTLWQ